MRKKITWLGLTLALFGVVAPAIAINESIDGIGIDARRLQAKPFNLIGRKIGIGQVEIGRPGKFGLDKAVSWKPAINFAGLFFRDNLAISNNNVDNHANMVANVMISQDKRLRGIAPGARLYSSAVGSLKRGGQAQECLATQHIALQNSGDVRSINFSFGESLERDTRIEPKLDGNALLTQCLDWSARVHDVVYAIAGNQGSGGIPIPTDSFNGITVAYSTIKQGKYSKVDFANLSSLPIGIGSRLVEKEINVGGRRAVSLLAPGNKIPLYNLDGSLTKVSGTSFAAPKITASVALLQEFGDRNLFSKQTNWSLDSRRHEVMKAVLLNSADKLLDRGDGMLLGMTRNVLTKDNRTWLESDAYKNAKIPLDMQMGAGHLNVFRAYQQFSAGQGKSNNLVNNLGWDYERVNFHAHRDYLLEKPLVKGSFAAITLVWDRLVELQDLNGNNLYDLEETFSDRGLNNLDIYLLDAQAKNTQGYACASISEVDSVEHIFCPIPKTGRYKIRVYYREQVNNAVQAYGLAWWTFINKK